MISITKREKSIYKLTVTGSIVNLLLLILKLIAGILGNSAAMIADAVHSISDFATDVIVLFFVRISSKPKDKVHKYGHGKYETLATLVIGVILMFVGLGILYSASTNIVNIIKGNRIETPGLLALLTAIFSVILKEWLFRYTIKKGRKLNSQVVIANAWHHRSDAFSSIGTMFGISGAYLLGSQWAILDSIAAVVVSIFIVKSSFSLIIPSVSELVDAALPTNIEGEIINIASSVPGVIKPHSLYTRRIGNKYAIEMHIFVDGKMNIREAHDIASKVEKLQISKFGSETHVNIHVEPYE